MAEVHVTADEKKSDGYHIGSITVNLNERSDVLEIKTKDSASPRKFQSEFTLDQLKQCGFSQLLSLDQCITVLVSVMDTGRIQYTTQPPKVIDADQASNAKPTTEDHDEFTDGYIDGSSMILLTTQAVGPCEIEYRLRLEEITVNPNNRLLGMMQQMKVEMTQIKMESKSIRRRIAANKNSQLLAMVQQMKAEMTELKTEVSQLKSVNAMQSVAMGAMQQKITSLQPQLPNDEKKSDLEIAVWASDSHIVIENKTRKYAILQYNCAIVEAPKDLFECIEDSTQIKFLETGLYHIHGFATANDKIYDYACRQLFLQINGEDILISNANTNNFDECYASMHFSTVHRCNANDVLSVIQYENRIVDDSQFNRLIIHRLSS